MPQFPLCSEFIPLLDTVKNQLVELKVLSQEFLRSGDDATKQKAFLKGEELRETKQRMIDLKEQPSEFEGHQISRMEKELLILVRGKLDSDLRYKINKNRVSGIDVSKCKNSAKTMESSLRFIKLFSQLRVFDCSYTEITALPELPQSLQELNCHYAPITVLSKLPQNLRELYCGRTEITILPELPHDLRVLFCDNSKIITLPELSDNLQYLCCYNAEIAILPELPDGLQTLDCRDTQITILPKLPQSLHELMCSGAPVAKNTETKKQLEEFKKLHPQFEYTI